MIQKRSTNRAVPNCLYYKFHKATQANLLVLILALTTFISPVSSLIAAKPIPLFENINLSKDWAIVNDTVMGGVSRSSARKTELGNLLFSGELSLDNNGGFVSVRSRSSEIPLERGAKLILRVRGDGRTYYVDLRAGRQGTAGSFRASFSTSRNEWTDVSIPLTLFVAQSFGRLYPNIPLNPKTIDSIGFTLSDKRAGPFSLEIEWAKIDNAPSAKESESGTFADSKSDSIQPQRQLIEFAISKGVPLYNEGNPGPCAAIYEIACRALLTTPDLPNASSETLRRALEEIETNPNDSQKAWILRYALDDILTRLPLN